MRVLATRVPVAVVAIAVLLSPASIGRADAHRLEKASKQRRHIGERARSQIGTRYSSGGERPSTGFDCSGFTSWVFDGHGAALARTSTRQFRAARNDGNRRVWKRSNLRKGDLVFFKTTGGRVGHAGIYLGRERFISSTSSGGVRIDSVYDRYYWGKRWVGATRHRSTRS